MRRSGSAEVELSLLTLTPEAEQAFLSTAAAAADYMAEARERPYDPIYKPDPNELMAAPMLDGSGVAHLYDRLIDVGNVESVDPRARAMKDLKFYANIVQSPDGRYALFLRRYSPKKELTRSRKLALLFRHGTYDTVRDPLLLFDEDYDCVIWESTILMRSATTYHAIFNLYQELAGRAGQLVDAIVEFVSNPDELREAWAGTQMAAKAAAVAERPYLSALTIDDIKQTIQRHRLEIDVVTDSEGRERLRFEASRDRRWLLLKLLDDDYLASEMTSEMYETNSKTPRARR
jgi:hypothetical protein